MIDSAANEKAAEYQASEERGYIFAIAGHHSSPCYVRRDEHDEFLDFGEYTEIPRRDARKSGTTGAWLLLFVAIRIAFAKNARVDLAPRETHRNFVAEGNLLGRSQHFSGGVISNGVAALEQLKRAALPEL